MENQEYLSREDFIALEKNRKLYKVINKIPYGELSYASIGDKFNSDILYERGYNMNKLVEEGILKIIGEPYDFQKNIIGTNTRSVFIKCPDCGIVGINEPLNAECGNCGHPKCITYYDAETIQNYIESLTK